MTSSSFKPDWLSAPGGTILDVMEERDLDSKELAALLKFSIERTERLIAGKEAITRDVATLLARELGGSESFWLSRESNYRNQVARLQTSGSATAAKAWLDELPVKDMQKFGWITSPGRMEDAVAACLQYFAVRNVTEWRSKYSQFLSLVAFRTSPTFKSEPGSVIAWLRRGEIVSERITCRNWSPASFERSLINMRRLTRMKDPAIFIPELRNIATL
jgi:HTH-type transcriptional regulator / antitoxin HigA